MRKPATRRTYCRQSKPWSLLHKQKCPFKQQQNQKCQQDGRKNSRGVRVVYIITIQRLAPPRTNALRRNLPLKRGSSLDQQSNCRQIGKKCSPRGQVLIIITIPRQVPRRTKSRWPEGAYSVSRFHLHWS